MTFGKGKIQILEKDEHGDWHIVKEKDNLLVDDGKELILDFLFGRKSWWNPKETQNYEGGDSGWDTNTYVGFGECMFNNASSERAAGTNTVSGNEYNYQVDDTWLVSPEDSFLSSELSGSRNKLSVTRRDQQVEMSTSITPGVDVPNGATVREFGVFLESSGPDEDPSLVDAEKPNSMICRVSMYDTGYFDVSGNEYNEKETYNELCYKDDGYVINAESKFRWIFGEI